MNKPKILIVENEILIAKQLSSYLEKQQYQVSGKARTGEEALELAKQESPDIILMDIDLDGELDGIQTAAIIHKTLIIPIVYLTSIRDKQTFERASETLPATFLTKPFKNLDVRNAIEMSIKSLSLLSHNKAKDVNLSVEIKLKNQEQNINELFVLKDRIFVKTKKGDFDRLLFSDIISIQTADHYLHILTPNGVIKTNYNFSSFLEMLKDYPIFRIHRGVAVNANYVYKLTRTEVFLEYPLSEEASKNQLSFPISDSYRDEALGSFRVLLSGRG